MNKIDKKSLKNMLNNSVMHKFNCYLRGLTPSSSKRGKGNNSTYVSPNKSSSKSKIESSLKKSTKASSTKKKNFKENSGQLMMGSFIDSQG
jgi:hypothetical protein